MSTSTRTRGNKRAAIPGMLRKANVSTMTVFQRFNEVLDELRSDDTSQDHLNDYKKLNELVFAAMGDKTLAQWMGIPSRLKASEMPVLRFESKAQLYSFTVVWSPRESEYLATGGGLRKNAFVVDEKTPNALLKAMKTAARSFFKESTAGASESKENKKLARRERPARTPPTEEQREEAKKVRKEMAEKAEKLIRVAASGSASTSSASSGSAVAIQHLEELRTTLANADDKKERLKKWLDVPESKLTRAMLELKGTDKKSQELLYTITVVWSEEDGFIAVGRPANRVEEDEPDVVFSQTIEKLIRPRLFRSVLRLRGLNDAMRVL